ncbi:DinB family protein [Pararcticibacter amylolyticus]|uniref:DinB-like domain-containing protein n=1 Tax=Pararcticibacter amylolyticus TaxID=2173175 RepID=A0A2U2P9V5_9SPHI|nr:DinB family protein [Pararcticibacter amylolyticus]PWG78150.1 hypothetical protein DDR33_23845 [Pararcticibacter amylolyticus]
MKTVGDVIHTEIETVVNGYPWYGSSVREILSQVDVRVVSERVGNAHSIKEILLHMTAWTEEVTARLRGNVASDPERGDWPDPSGYSWPDLTGLFQEAHSELKQAIAELREDQWDTFVSYEEDENPLITFRQTLTGLGQHHTYHLGQIAILNKQLSKTERL